MERFEDIKKVAEHFVSAQCSYDSQEHKQELIHAFIAGANSQQIYNAMVEPYEGGTAYVRGWRAAIGEVFKELKKVTEECPPLLMAYLLDILNAKANEIIIESKLND